VLKVDLTQKSAKCDSLNCAPYLNSTSINERDSNNDSGLHRTLLTALHSADTGRLIGKRDEMQDQATSDDRKGDSASASTNVDLPTTSFGYRDRSIRISGVAPDDHVFKLVGARGQFYELDVLEAVSAKMVGCAGDGIAVDAGAFIGNHTVFLALFCPIARVVAFEPNPKALQALDSNLRQNNVQGRVTVVPKALAEEDGGTQYFYDLIENNAGRSTVKKERLAGSIPVQVTNIDSNIAPETRVDFIKVDVEGMEVQVLRGARRIIRTSKPLLCVEAHGPRQLRNLLRELGIYAVVDCLGATPTYLLRPASAWKRLANWVWLGFSLQSNSTLRSYVLRLARMLSR
jgi:FkbM family methyltransferase